MNARGETMALYRSYLRLRHQFPIKQGRSVLKRWANICFSLRQAEFHRVELKEGRQVADERAREWREDAKDDLQFWESLADLPEKARRRLLERIIKFESK